MIYALLAFWITSAVMFLLGAWSGFILQRRDERCSRPELEQAYQNLVASGPRGRQAAQRVDQLEAELLRDPQVLRRLYQAALPGKSRARCIKKLRRVK